MCGRLCVCGGIFGVSCMFFIENLTRGLLDLLCREGFRAAMVFLGLGDFIDSLLFVLWRFWMYMLVWWVQVDFLTLVFVVLYCVANGGGIVVLGDSLDESVEIEL